jgi:hypothetical protein
MDFEPFPKIARLNRDIVITEKIDGTNAAVLIEEVEPTPSGSAPIPGGFMLNDTTPAGRRTFVVQAQSRKRLITPEDDNFGFAGWVYENRADLIRLLGPGRHFGEWWGRGIQRGYGLDHKRFSLFNPTFQWGVLIDQSPLRRAGYIDTVPVLYEGPFLPIGEFAAEPTPWHQALWELRNTGSAAAPGFMRPEGIVVYHTAARQPFKVTLEHDEKPKGSSE